MQPFKYMITRRCLRDESLYPTRRLAEEFSGHQELKFYDEAGHEYTLHPDSDGCVRGAGQLYHDHNLGVNDLLLLTPLLSGAYRVESVVKPYERPKASWEETAEGRDGATVQSLQRPSDATPSPSMTVPTPPQATRVTAHVREVRAPASSAAQLPAGPAPAAKRLPTTQNGSAQTQSASGVRIQEVRRSSPTSATPPQQAGEASGGKVKVRAVRTSEQAESGDGASTQPSPQRRVSEVGRRTDHGPSPQRSVRAIRGSRQASGGQASGGQAGSGQAGSGQPGQSGGSGRSELVANPATAATKRLQRDLQQRGGAGGQGHVHTQQAHDQQFKGQCLKDQRLKETPVDSPQVQSTPTDMALQELGRLTGYRVDYLGGGLTRLRADLGQHSHHVLIADSASAASSHEWRSRGEAVPTYKLWLVDEGQAVADAPILTRDAVQMLLRQARLAPLSALDLRPYWHARRMDARSAENLASLAKQYLAQRGAFAGVLAALAQQPANSLVSRARLAELPLGLSPADLDRALSALTQPPLQLLMPLDKDEFLLRQSIPAFLSGFGEYVQGVSRRLVTADQLGLEAALDDPEELRAAASGVKKQE